MGVAYLTWFESNKLKEKNMLHRYVLTFKEAPASEDEKGDEEVSKVVHGGDHHTWSAWSVIQSFWNNGDDLTTKISTQLLE